MVKGLEIIIIKCRSLNPQTSLHSPLLAGAPLVFIKITYRSVTSSIVKGGRRKSQWVCDEKDQCGEGRWEPNCVTIPLHVVAGPRCTQLNETHVGHDSFSQRVSVRAWASHSCTLQVKKDKTILAFKYVYVFSDNHFKNLILDWA